MINCIGCSSYLEAYLYACNYSYREQLAGWGPQINHANGLIRSGNYVRPIHYHHIDDIRPNNHALPYFEPIPVDQAPAWPNNRRGFLSNPEVFMRQVNRQRFLDHLRVTEEGRAREAQAGGQAQAQNTHAAVESDPPPPPYTEVGGDSTADVSPTSNAPSSPTVATFFTAPTSPIQDANTLSHANPSSESIAVVPQAGENARGRHGGPIYITTPFEPVMEDYLRVHQQVIIEDHNRRQMLADLFTEFVMSPPARNEIGAAAVEIARIAMDIGLGFGHEEEARFFARWVLRLLSSQGTGK